MFLSHFLAENGNNEAEKKKGAFQVVSFTVACNTPPSSAPTFGFIEIFQSNMEKSELWTGNLGKAEMMMKDILLVTLKHNFWYALQHFASPKFANSIKKFEV